MARNLVALTIAVGATASTVAQGSGQTLCGLYIPAALTGTTLTFNAYGAGGQFGNLITDGSGNAVTKTVKSATDQYIDLSQDLIAAGIDGIQVISGTTQATNPANLTAVFR
jgi:hypothetical protein